MTLATVAFKVCTPYLSLNSEGRTLPVVSRNLYKEDILGLLSTIFIPLALLQYLSYHVRSSRNPTDRICGRHDVPKRKSASSYNEPMLMTSA